MERVWSTSGRGYSVRSILTFVITVFIAALLWVTFGNQTATHALDAPSASWKGESILYDGHQYFHNPDTATGNSLGLVQGTHVYTYIPDNSGNPQKTVNAFVIYFAPGTDPPTATTASFASYTYTVATKEFSNPTNQKSIVITTQANQDSISSCTVDGVGWIICPVSVFLSNGMDVIFKAVASFMAVQPVTVGDTHSTLYIAWNIMRSFANVAFIIAFLVIIYSQITNLGISNYGLKKLLPRLIIAAILVNLSFFVCSLAVDISNIFGYSLQEIFVQIRQNTFNITNDTWSTATTNWTGITSAVLSGGALGVAGIALAGDFVGAIYVLLPILVGVILTALFVLLILAARQAIIVLLIIVSPLAFVAFLLPNTEEWFKKWRQLFMTMLIFFPAFSLVFGGSQLAGGLIIQNATSVFMVILGLAVQIAPLVITPLILRFSGDVLGKVAGIVNDPRKGVLDRTKNWSKERQEMRRLQSLKKTGTPNPFRKTAQMLDNSNRNVKNRTAQYTTENDNRYHSDPNSGYAKIHRGTYEANQDKEIIENEHNQHIQRTVNQRGTRLHLKNAELEAGKLALEKLTQITTGDIAEYKDGKVPAGTSSKLARVISQLNADRESLAIEKVRTSNAEDSQQRNFAEALKASAALRTRAGGIKKLGADSVLAAAVTAVQKADSEDIKNIQDSADIAPGDIAAMSNALKDAIRNGKDIQARAYQNMLLNSGGAGISKFRDTMLDVGSNIPADVQEKMRDNILSNHPQVKAKANDITEWAVQGGTMQARAEDVSSWNGLTDDDISMLHKSSLKLLAESGAISRERAQRILNDDRINIKINDEGKRYLESIK